MYIILDLIPLLKLSIYFKFFDVDTYIYSYYQKMNLFSLFRCLKFNKYCWRKLEETVHAFLTGGLSIWYTHREINLIVRKIHA